MRLRRSVSFVGEDAVLEGNSVLGDHALHEPLIVRRFDPVPGGEGRDARLAKLLDLAGALDVATGAWLSPVTGQGAVGLPLAMIGHLHWAEVERTITAANAIPGLFASMPVPLSAPCVHEHLVCAIGDRSSGRAALFLRPRPWHASVRTQLGEAIERIRQLVHMAWIIHNEMTDGMAPPGATVEAQPAELLAEQCPFGMLVLDIDQHVHLANAPARLLIADAEIAGMIGGRMVLTHSDDAIRFQVALRAVLAHDDGASRQSIAITGKDGAPLLVSISRLSDNAGDAQACVIITRPTAAPEPDIHPLAEHFNLTPVEARVVCQLARGLSVQDAAHSLQLKVQTVRTYLKQIFQKTGTHRQVELMQLMQNGMLPSLY